MNSREFVGLTQDAAHLLAETAEFAVSIGRVLEQLASSGVRPSRAVLRKHAAACTQQAQTLRRMEGQFLQIAASVETDDEA